MVQSWVLHWVPLWLTHFYAIMKKDGQINAQRNSNQCFTGDMWMIFLYSSEKLFPNYFNSCHENIKFTPEKESNNKLSFLDIEISRNKNQLITSVYRKPTFSGVFSYFDSFIPRGYKFNLVLTLIFGFYSICCSTKLFHIEIMQLKEIFEKNRYGNKFFDRCP